MQAFRRSTLSSLRNIAAVQRRGYAAASPIYSETVKNLRINGDTKVIFQGFTGKQGTYVFPMLFANFILLTLTFCFCTVSTLSKQLLMVFPNLPAWTEYATDKMELTMPQVPRLLVAQTQRRPARLTLTVLSSRM